MKPQAFALVPRVNGSVATTAKACRACRKRSSRPKRLRRPTPQVTVERIESLRRQRMPGKEIAAQVGVSAATVSRVLQRLGLNKLSALAPAEPPRRYERERPGEMILSTSRGSAASIGAGHRVRGERREEWRNRGAGWESSTSPSTTPRASPSAGS